MARKPESNLQLRIQKAVRAEFVGAYVRKIHGSEFQAGGMPDLVCCIYGQFVGLEVKMPGEEQSELQRHEQAEIIRASGHCFVVTSPEDAIARIRQALNSRGHRRW